MNSARKFLFKNIVVSYSVLVFILLILVSGVWVFFLRELLLQAGVSDVRIVSSLFQVGSFIFVLILVFLIVAILLGFIFIEGFRAGFKDLIRQISGLKTAKFGMRVMSEEKNELSDLADEVNQVLNRFEQQIMFDFSKLTEEEKQFKVEQGLLSTEQKKIYEEKEKLDYVLSRITDGVILLNRQRNVVLMNKAASEITGFNQLDAVNRSISWLVKFFEKDQEIPMNEYVPVVATNTMRDNAFIKKSLRLETNKITPKLVDLVCVRLTLIHEQDLGYMIVLHDQTSKLEVEKNKDSLLTSFASELRQPISLISNPVVMSAGIAHLSMVMENLLTTAAIDDGTIIVAQAEVDLIEIINSAINIVQPVASDRQVVLSFTVPENFNAKVKGDQGRMSQVVLNLLLNAIYFTMNGGSVTVSLSQSDTALVLEIQDTGIGIRTDAMRDLFTKFYTVSNNVGIETGIGLGLYVCKHLVELQGGKIWIDSVEGRGSVVSVSLQKAG